MSGSLHFGKDGPGRSKGCRGGVKVEKLFADYTDYEPDQDCGINVSVSYQPRPSGFKDGSGVLCIMLQAKDQAKNGEYTRFQLYSKQSLQAHEA